MASASTDAEDNDIGTIADTEALMDKWRALARKNQESIHEVLHYQVRYNIEKDTAAHLERELLKFQELYAYEKQRNNEMHGRLQKLHRQITNLRESNSELLVKVNGAGELHVEHKTTTGFFGSPVRGLRDPSAFIAAGKSPRASPLGLGPAALSLSPHGDFSTPRATSLTPTAQSLSLRSLHHSSRSSFPKSAPISPRSLSPTPEEAPANIDALTPPTSLGGADANEREQASSPWKRMVSSPLFSSPKADATAGAPSSSSASSSSSSGRPFSQEMNTLRSLGSEPVPHAASPLHAHSVASSDASKHVDSGPTVPDSSPGSSTSSQFLRPSLISPKTFKNLSHSLPTPLASLPGDQTDTFASKSTSADSSAARDRERRTTAPSPTVDCPESSDGATTPRVSFSSEVVAISPSESHKRSSSRTSPDIPSKSTHTSLTPDETNSSKTPTSHNSRDNENSSKTQSSSSLPPSSPSSKTPPSTAVAVANQLASSSSSSRHWSDDITQRRPSAARIKVGGVTATGFIQSLAQSPPSAASEQSRKPEKPSLLSRSLSLKKSPSPPPPENADAFTDGSRSGSADMPPTGSPRSTDTQISISSLDSDAPPTATGRAPTARRCASVDIRSPSSLRDKNSKLFDHFFVVGVEPRHNVAWKKRTKWFQKPTILCRYPDAHCSQQYLEGVPQFCFPNEMGIELKEISAKSRTAVHEIRYGYHSANFMRNHDCHMFLLKEEFARDGQLYGLCVTQREIVVMTDTDKVEHNVESRVCYCFLSQYPYFELHVDILLSILGCQKMQRLFEIASSSIHHHSSLILENPAVKQILERYAATLVPSAGQWLVVRISEELPLVSFCRPDDNEHEFLMRRWCCPLAWSHMTPAVMSSLMEMILREHTIVVVGELAIVSAAVLALALLVQPLGWEGPILPVLPESLIGVLDSPVPLLAGIVLLPEEMQDRTAIDDHTGVWFPRDNVIWEPRAMTDKIIEKSDFPTLVEPHLATINATKKLLYQADEDQHEAVEQILRHARNLVVSLVAESDIRRDSRSSGAKKNGRSDSPSSPSRSPRSIFGDEVPTDLFFERFTHSQMLSHYYAKNGFTSPQRSRPVDDDNTSDSGGALDIPPPPPASTRPKHLSRSSSDRDRDRTSRDKDAAAKEGRRRSRSQRERRKQHRKGSDAQRHRRHRKSAHRSRSRGRHYSQVVASSSASSSKSGGGGGGNSSGSNSSGGDSASTRAASKKNAPHEPTKRAYDDYVYVENPKRSSISGMFSRMFSSPSPPTPSVASADRYPVSSVASGAGRASRRASSKKRSAAPHMDAALAVAPRRPVL